MLSAFAIFKKTAQRKQSPDWRKFAQSGRPVCGKSPKMHPNPFFVKISTQLSPRKTSPKVGLLLYLKNCQSTK
jgi:hypothetical protein